MRRGSGLLSFLVAALWPPARPYLGEFTRAWGFSWIIDAMNPYVAEWGPSAVFVGLGLYLFWHTGNRASSGLVHRRMIALVCMIVFGMGFLGSAVVYFWPQTNISPRVNVSETPPAPVPPPPPAPFPVSPAPSSIARNPVLIEPPKSALKNPDGSQRIFIRVLPHEMSAAFDGRTANQAMTLVAPYLLKWIAISAIVENARTYSDGTTIVHFVSVTNQTTVTLTIAEFGEKWRDNLSIINKGDRLKVACRISRIEQSMINVDSCEII
jgi:hypothetical protein